MTQREKDLIKAILTDRLAEQLEREKKRLKAEWIASSIRRETTHYLPLTLILT